MADSIHLKFRPVFRPHSIAVVGASEDSTKTGARYFENLVRAGFKGKVYPVNVKQGNIMASRYIPP